MAIQVAQERLTLDSLKDVMSLAARADLIARQVGHVTTLVNDLLDVSRVTRGVASACRAWMAGSWRASCAPTRPGPSAVHRLERLRPGAGHGRPAHHLMLN